MSNNCTSCLFFDLTTPIYLFSALIIACTVPFFTSLAGVSLPAFYRKMVGRSFNPTLMLRITLLLLPVLFLFVAGCKQDAPASAPVSNVPQVDTAALSQFRQNNWKNHGCDLITEADMQRLFGIDPKETTLNGRSLPDQAFCIHSWNRPDWKEREANNEKGGNTFMQTRNSLVVQVFSYGTNEHALQQFEMLKRDRRDTYEESITGLGDDALWGTTTVTLLVKKSHLVLSITLDCMDNPHDNLAKAKEVAAVALQKL